MNNLFSSLPNEEFEILFLATIGGLIVFLGLAIEKLADWMNERFLGEYKPHKNLELFGWWILMLGILIEVAVAGLSANNEWQDKLINQPINKIEAQVNFLVIGKSFSKESFSPSPMAQFSQKDFAFLTFFSQFSSNSNEIIFRGGFQMTCVEYKSILTSINDQEGREFKLKFEWPKIEWIPDFKETVSNLSLNNLEKQYEGVIIEIPELGSETNKIFSGNCKVIFNGSQAREYSFPKFSELEFIRCSPLLTNTTLNR